MLRKSTLLAALFLVLTTAPATAAQTRWSPYDLGMDSAKASGKPVLINFYSDDCRWCDRMDAETYSNDEIASYLDRYFVAIKVHGEKEKDLKRKFTIVGYPTIWFIDSAGERIAFIPGYVPADEFLPALKFIQTGAYGEMTFEEFLDQGLDKE
jgi:thioredoxin-related protein